MASLERTLRKDLERAVKKARNVAEAGARLLVPFGTRKLTGVVLRVHDEPTGVPLKDALRLIDPEPVLDDELLALGKWISGYYCAPLGEVLRSMLRAGIFPEQLLVEFDQVNQPLTPLFWVELVRVLRALRDAGYRLVRRERANYVFVLSIRV